MRENLKIEVVPADQLSPDRLASIHSLCRRAYQEDLAPLFKTFKQATHLLGFLDSTIVSHAMWVLRRLQPGGGPCLRAAYVEMVATEPRFQGRGFATALMRRVAGAIDTYDLGGLCPADTELYARLGWVFWRGPLFIRSPEGMIPTPEERIMILPLSKTPPLNLDAPLSAEWREGELW